MSTHPNMERACDLARQIAAATGTQLRPYQIEAAGRCLEGNTLLNLDPGVGKTLSAAAAVRGLRSVIIVVPKVARSAWYKDLPRAAGISEVIELEGNRKLRAVRRVLSDGVVVHEEPVTSGQLTSGYFIVTHECIGSWADTLRTSAINMVANKFEKPKFELPTYFDAVILDESHRHSNKDSKRAIGMSKLTQITGRVILLSGTPDMGGTHRMWFQLRLLAPWQFGRYFQFVLDYAGGVETDYGIKPTRGTNLEELAERIEPWVLTYKQEDVLPYLPSNTRDRIVVPLTAAQARQLGSKLEAARKALRRLGEASADRVEGFLPGEVIEARLACAEAKVDAVAELASELIKSGQRVVVWAWHKAVCKQLADKLRQTKLGAVADETIPVHVVTGDIQNSQTVDTIINRWSSETAVLIATIGKLGEGEDRLVAACWQLFLEIDWLPQAVRQAERRLVRLSQTRPVNTRFFEVELNFERSLMDRVLDRAEDSDTLFGGSDFVDIGSLFGVRSTGDSGDVLRRLSGRLS